MDKEIKAKFEAFEIALTTLMIALPGFNDAKYKELLRWQRDRFRENNSESQLADEIDRILAGPLKRVP